MSALGCPRCGTELGKAHAPDVTLFGCRRCAGVWVDLAGSWLVARALLSPEARALAAGRTRERAAYRSPGLTRSPHCPVCKKPLGQTRVLPAEVTVDACPDHGTWFDAGEVARVVAMSDASRELAPADRTAGASDDPADFRNTSDQIVVALFSLLSDGGDGPFS